MRKTAIAVAIISLFVVPALAQTPPAPAPVRVRGTVEKLDGQNLTVKSRDGQSLAIALAPNIIVSYLTKKSAGDIKTGDFVASTGIKGTDGKLHAIEVRIFPENLRGVGEGQYPWDLKPDSIMTNATVGTITKSPQGNVVKVSYKGSESEFTIDPDTPVYGTATDGDTSLLKPGVAVFVIAQKQDDGKMTSSRLYTEKDGIKPSM